MKIGIIGSGKIAGSLGKHWAKAGHEVLFGVKEPEKLNALMVEIGKNAAVLNLNGVFNANADAFLLAMPFKAIEELAELYAGAYDNKIVIDATNPVPERDGDIANEVLKANYNASEYTAVKFSTAKTVKAFNTITPEDLQNRAFRSQHKLAIPYASQDLESKKIAKQLIQDIGFEAFYIGDLSDTNIMDPNQAIYRKSLERDEMKRLVNSIRTF
ncbi:NAD(P)-binding domain-containing protein [Tamlana sp. 2_MG-2023]|uniref:NADPH-dependent F420 reductase n=1 Tax=unclassified Tamlana TaxID=2614803 RepID=UPI0026E28482|nr:MULTISPECIES: NAD(P)-binding domain-containing protein [unclassified Tamlana]MDO6760390.1 NAD(P)-binding domain-containing protein [Tamlana sp. 2_MG-2023]MDO6789911.1 NAD(P)-binding domain-containing protein [Tamlana sp. 1_MG-2023]